MPKTSIPLLSVGVGVLLSLFNSGDFLTLFTVVASVTRISVDEDLDLLDLIFGDRESFFSGELAGLLFLFVPFLLLALGIGSAPI